MQKTAVVVVLAILGVVTILLVAGILFGAWSASSVLPIIYAVVSATITQILNKSETLFKKKSEPVVPAYPKREFPESEVGFWGKLRDRSLPALAIADGLLCIVLVYQNVRALFPQICFAGTTSCERALLVDYNNFGIPIFFVSAILLIWFGVKFARTGLI